MMAFGQNPAELAWPVEARMHIMRGRHDTLETRSDVVPFWAWFGFLAKPRGSRYSIFVDSGSENN